MEIATDFLLPLAAFALHELAHAAMARIRGLKVKGIAIDGHGIGVRRERGTDEDTVWIALFGPAVNLLLAFGFAGTDFGLVNAVWGLVNLLPIRGSDGKTAYEAFQRTLYGNHV